MMPRPWSGARRPEFRPNFLPTRVCGKKRRVGRGNSAGALTALLAILAGAIFLPGCGANETVFTPAGIPVITVSPSSASVQAGNTLQFAVTVTNTSGTTLMWSVNNIVGGNAALGTVNSAGLYTAPAAVPNPSTVTVRATSTAETNPYGSATVTITAAQAKATVSVSPVVSTAVLGSTLQFTAGVTGVTNTAVQWSVNGVFGGNSTVGTIDSSGLYTAPLAIPVPSTVTVTAASLVQPSASSSSSVTIVAPTAPVSLTPNSTSVWAGSTVPFTATVTGATNFTVQWLVNGTSGGNSTLGTICNATPAAPCATSELYTAPAMAPSPATVTVTATVFTLVNGQSQAYGTASASVTLVPPTVQSIGPVDSSLLTAATSQYTANLIPANSVDVKWWVNGVVGGSSTVGTISSSGLYLAPSSVPNPPTVVVSVTGQGNTSDIASTTLTVTSANTAPLFVNLGLNGNTGSPYTTYYNGLFTSVNVCLPGTIQCQTIPNVLVDTGSVGLRVLNSALTTVPSTELGIVQDSHGNPVEECTQFNDTSYGWGPVMVADIGVGGELASSVPIQILGGTQFTVPAASCLSLGTGPQLDSVAALGANGILGVGTSIRDCGLNCSGGQTFSGYPYYVCPKNACIAAAVPVIQQVANPVAFFAKDNNGLEILLPAIAATGAPSLPFTTPAGTGLVPAGQLIFGVGTQSNNGLGSATLYALNEQGDFSQIVYNEVTYTSGGYVDSGSNALFVSDPLTLGIVNCPDNPYYCPSATLPLSLGVSGTNGTSGTASLSIANADQLIETGNTAFDNLGGASGTSALTDYFDLGLPFFFGRAVFVGIGGTTIPNNASAPYGYYAF